MQGEYLESVLTFFFFFFLVDCKDCDISVDNIFDRNKPKLLHKYNSAVSLLESKE